MNRENTAGKRKPAKKFLRVFEYILASAAVLYIVFFLISLIIVNGYDSLKYRSGGWIVTEITTIDLKSGSWHITSQSEAFENRNFEADMTVSENDLRRLKMKMAVYLVPFWLPEYSNPMIMDGDMWGFSFYSGGSEKSVKGYNAYPIGYRSITRLLYGLEDEAVR